MAKTPQPPQPPQPPTSPSLDDLPQEQLAPLLDRLKAERARREEARAEARRVADLERLAAGQGVDWKSAFGGWLKWATEPGVRETLARPIGDGDWVERPIVEPGDVPPGSEWKPELIASPPLPITASAPTPRAAIPDDAVPRPVQIERNAEETAEAGWPPQIETRYYLVFAGEVLLCDARGKPSDDASCRQALTPGAEPEAIARSLWLRRLEHTDFDMPARALYRRAPPIAF
jgi:hypothetical protein